jgi:hypothetical protein
LPNFFRQRSGHPDTGLYQYALYVAPTAGAQEEVFEPTFNLPLYSFRGIGRLAGAYMVTEHPQVLVSQAIPIAGIGGPSAGQIFNQPVVYPDNIECCESVCGGAACQQQ